MPPDEKIYVNGINAETGEYMVSPMTVQQILPYITGKRDEKGVLNKLKDIWSSLTSFSVGVEPDWTNLAEAGWGLVFRQGESETIKAALEPLYQHRRAQIGDDHLVKKMEYLPGDTWETFLGRYGAGTGSIDPREVPYYLLLVGSPEHIPFSVGYLLDVKYAVGRLDFDNPADYRTYVTSVIEYESATKVPNGREAVFFGTRHQFDPATNMSADRLVTPLAEGSPYGPAVAQELGFQSKKLVEKAATRGALTRVFEPPAGFKPPAFLFTATHGMVWPLGKSIEQRASQGALLCQDWPGFGKISPNHYFAASDLPMQAQLQGMITFHFACYSAGTPLEDRFLHKADVKPQQIAPVPFIASLPKTLLSHPAGGALAVIGHVERAWDTSITTLEAGDQIDPFRNAIAYILNGLPVGYAVKDLNMRFAEYSANLSELLQPEFQGKVVSEEKLASAWIKRNDSEGYIVIGDPAVRLRINDLK